VNPPGVRPLAAAGDAALFGAKAANLSTALRSGLPVPDGIVLDPDLVARLATEYRDDNHIDPSRPTTDDALSWLAGESARWGTLLAVRSSALEEDGPAASFAGQHVTRLGVRATPGALHAAVNAVHESVVAPHALAYREHMGLNRSSGVAVLVQPLVAAEVSGVMFTRDPVTGVDELVVEASWGLGEPVVGGLVTPDSYRIGPDGSERDRRLGRKSLSITPVDGGGTEERDVDPTRARDPCLDDGGLRALWELAGQCQNLFGDTPLDIEWAFGGGRLHLLQCRQVTVR
jgi:pyruvate,water dikinase